ncbi:MAG: hypothetical protein JOZ69_11785 [Myxococcales bacterium]|nr:hypothetical protein [Myxococcales bacterium]
MSALLPDPLAVVRAFLAAQRDPDAPPTPGGPVCPCRYCAALPSRVPLAAPEDARPVAFRRVEDAGQATARPPPVAATTYGAHATHEPSRLRHAFLAAYWREPKDDDELEDFVFGRTKERASRAKIKRKPERVLAPLTLDERASVQETLRCRRVPARFERDEWVNEVWVELVNPPSRAEASDSLMARVVSAIYRAEKSLRPREIAMDRDDLERVHAHRRHSDGRTPTVREREDDFYARSGPYNREE